MRILQPLIWLLLILSIGLSQDNWEEFKREKSEYYYSLAGAEVQNFSCLITSSEYIRYVHDKVDSAYYFPLKIIWTREGKVYYVMQPFPPGISDASREELVGRIEELKKIFKGVLPDWQQFSLFSPFSDIPQNASVRFGLDTVGVTFKISEGDEHYIAKKLFSRGGQLARVEWRGEGLRIATYPYYKEMENVWLCQGWQSQFYRDGEVSSGMAVILKLERTENLWLPREFDIIAQTSDRPEQRSVVRVYLKDYTLNENLEIIPSPGELPPTEDEDRAQ